MKVIYPIGKWNNQHRARTRHIPNDTDERPLCWKPGKFKNAFSWHIEDGDPTCAVCIREQTRILSHKHMLVQIRLTDAAPDLLAAAIEFLQYFERVSLIEVSSDLAESLVKLRDAVAKAEGRPA